MLTTCLFESESAVTSALGMWWAVAPVLLSFRFTSRINKTFQSLWPSIYGNITYRLCSVALATRSLRHVLDAVECCTVFLSPSQQRETTLERWRDLAGLRRDPVSLPAPPQPPAVLHPPTEGWSGPELGRGVGSGVQAEPGCRGGAAWGAPYPQHWPPWLSMGIVLALWVLEVPFSFLLSCIS